MTRVVFYADNSRLYGFKVSGHSSFDCEDQEGKIVCSAVSSAVYMTANTLTEIIGEKCDIQINDGEFLLKASMEKKETEQLLKGLKLHLTELSHEYPKRIKITAEV